MDSDEPRRGGRAPVNRQGRGRPGPRRTAPARAGGSRRGTPPRRPAPRRERPAPPPPAPPHGEPPHGDDPYGENPYADTPYGASPYGENSYGENSYGEAAYGGAPYASYEDAPYEEAYGDAPPPGPRGRKPKKPAGQKRPGKAKKPGKPKKPGAAGQAGQTGPTRKASEAGGLGPKLYFGAAAVLGLVVLLGLGAVVALRGGSGGSEQAAATKIGTPAGNGPSPTSYSSSPSASAYGGITARRADPDPLTIEEAFPAEAATLSVPGGAAKVKLRAKRLDADCAAAVWGGSVGAELGRGGCTQAARGVYSDTKSGYGLAVAVFNLNSSADADRFVAKLEETIGAGFVLPLQAPAPLDGFGRGFGMARGLAMGHFAVVSWAARLDGKGTATDETLLSLLIEGGKSPAVLGRAARASGPVTD